MSELPLLPRRLFFGNPDRVAVQISPDGGHLSWVAPVNGVLNLWAAPREDLGSARPLTRDAGRGIRHYQWAYDSAHLLYIQDEDGDENWRIHAVTLETGEARNLTPMAGVQAQITCVSPEFPKELIVALNQRHPQWHDYYRLDLANGEMTLVLQNDRFLGVAWDDQFEPRVALEMRADGGIDLFLPAAGDWRHFDSVPSEDVLTTAGAGFDRSGQVVYMKDSRGRDTAALLAWNLCTRESQFLAGDAQVDVADVLLHPTTKEVQAVSFFHARKRWEVLDSSLETDFALLTGLCPGELTILSRSLDDRLWVVAYVVDDGPMPFHLYDRSTGETRFLFTNRPDLENQPLAAMHAAVIQARDGLELTAYYTLPVGSDLKQKGIPDSPLPLVLRPHGGPWSRDYWGYHPAIQWLANRGYAVLTVNFRSSTGFGKAFVNAGDREWGGKIIDDQVDAVQWAVDQGLADPARLAIFGGSFGGYSTLAGLTLHPDLYACGVDLVGVANLETLLETVPPYWKPQIELFYQRIGDPRTEEGLALLRAHSPITHIGQLCKPLLIGHGANDPRVKRAESDQIVRALQERNVPVTYVMYQDEGHGFARPENSLSFFAIAESFLASCLGGRYEPMGDDYRGSSCEILTGAEAISGLPETLSH